MEITALKHAYDALLEQAHDRRFVDPAQYEWAAERILAHVIATNRMIAAGAAELLAGRIPVLDNRPTQSAAYLDAIVSVAGTWPELVQTVDRSNREVLTLAAQLSDEHLAVRVPAIFVDNGAIRVERPIPFQMVLGAGHVEGHTEQLGGLAR
jgi:hypothetical protein